MFLQSSYTTEYTSEANLILTQEDFGNKITDLLLPIKLHLQDDQDLLAFSLTRYCGGDAHLAFYAQWMVVATELTLNPDELRLKTREHLLKKHSSYITTSPEYSGKINEIADSLYLPLQLNVLQSKSFELAHDIVHRQPALKKYLSRAFVGRIMANELRARSFWLQDDMTLTEFLGLQRVRESYLYIGYPVLIGLMYGFHLEHSVVNPQAIKWVLVEDIVEIISALHQTSRGYELESMIYYATLSEDDKLLWLSLSHKDQKKLLLSRDFVQTQSKEHRINLHQKGTAILDTLVLPDMYMNMLKDLLDWALSANFVQE